MTNCKKEKSSIVIVDDVENVSDALDVLDAFSKLKIISKRFVSKIESRFNKDLQ